MKFDLTQHAAIKEIATDLANAPMMWEPYCKRPKNAYLAILKGMTLGMCPVTSLESIALVRGKLSLWGDGFLSVIQQHPAYEGHQEMTHEEIEKNGNKAVCTFYRKASDGTVREYSATYSIEDAKRAGRWGSMGPWKTNPHRMLAMRARGFAGRNAFSDALRGLVIHEEAIDIAEQEEAMRRAPVEEKSKKTLGEGNRPVIAAPKKPDGVELAKEILGAEEPLLTLPDLPDLPERAKEPSRQSPHAAEAEDEQKATRRRRTPPATPPAGRGRRQ